MRNAKKQDLKRGFKISKMQKAIEFFRESGLKENQIFTQKILPNETNKSSLFFATKNY